MLMYSFIPHKSKLQRLESSYTRLMRRSYNNAQFNKQESLKAKEEAERVLVKIQKLLNQMIAV